MSETIYFDSETSGLGDDAEIIQVGIINKKGEVLLDTYVQCQGEIPEEATAIHGITKKDLESAPTWPEIHDKFFEILSTADTIKIYNAEYDLRLVKQTAERYGLENPGFADKAQCVMKAYGNMHFGGEWIKLTDACHYEQIDTSHLTAHNALADCEMTRLLDIELEREEAKRLSRKSYRDSIKELKLALVPLDYEEYPYFGMADRPSRYKTLSQLRKGDVKRYEFAGTCCNNYGNRGFLFKPREANKKLSASNTMKDVVRFYDIHGKETDDFELAFSKVIMNPKKFDFYVKNGSKVWSLFGRDKYKWEYHHTSTTFGLWKCPEGLPMRFDGVDNVQAAQKHALRIGSDWKPE